MTTTSEAYTHPITHPQNERWVRPCDGCQSMRNMPRGSTICLSCEPEPVQKTREPLFLPNLRAVRESQRISQEKLARWSGVSAKTIWNVEKGRHMATKRTAEALAAVLGVSVSTLR